MLTLGSPSETSQTLARRVPSATDAVFRVAYGWYAYAAARMSRTGSVAPRLRRRYDALTPTPTGQLTPVEWSGQ